MNTIKKPYNLLELDINKLLEENKIEDVVEIEKLLDAEIERKRIELRSMVGDRYKDVLAASDAIKNMKTISQEIVNNIQSITDLCEHLTNPSETTPQQTTNADKNSHEERVLIIQIRLAIFINEQIWIALDDGDNLTAAQFYLLAQHIHIGLSLSKIEYLAKLGILNQIKNNLHTLREQIFKKIKQKLESVEIDAQETSSNLNALLLLQNQSTNELIDVFIEHRNKALNTVVNSSHVNVRKQISAMVRCLITTVHLLHDCFLSGGGQKGLIWLQLDEIVRDSSTPTILKLNLPETPLNSYIPDLIRQFRPKYKNQLGEPTKDAIVLDNWLQSTKQLVKEGLEKSLKLTTNVRGLHIIREEALKIELPANWSEICAKCKLPDDFNVWYYFLQAALTARVRDLLTAQLDAILADAERQIAALLAAGGTARVEAEMARGAWLEAGGGRSGLAMQARGYSPSVAALCARLDAQFLALLADAAPYLHGRELGGRAPAPAGRRHADRGALARHLRLETRRAAARLAGCAPRPPVAGALLCARALQAALDLCPHFAACAALDGPGEEWAAIGGAFRAAGAALWAGWVERTVRRVEAEAKVRLGDVTCCSMISILPIWDTIDIQEQTDEKVFKSQIKVPLKPSLALHGILDRLNDEFSAVLPQTIPKQIHLEAVERAAERVLAAYASLAESGRHNQHQALQFLFDVRFVTVVCVRRENGALLERSQAICERLRALIDPFDLNVFYAHLQANVRRSALQSQVLFGCLLPSSGQLASLSGAKEQEREASILALSVPTTTSWFPHLPISVPSQRLSTPAQAVKVPVMREQQSTKKSQDPTAVMRSSAAALFGGLTTDWFT